MTGPVRTRMLAAVAGVSVLALAAPAPAQFVRLPLGNGYYFQYSRVRQVSIPFMTANGPATLFYRDAGFRPYNRTNVVVPYYGGGYMSGGSGTGRYNSTAAKRAADLAAAQRAGGQAVYRAARSGITDQFAYERGARPEAKPDDLARAAKLVDRDLLTADPAEIASGAALNGLLAAVEPLQAKPGKPVDSPLLGPDLASRVVFEGGPNADTLNLLRDGRLKFPAALRASDLADWRAEAEDAYTAVVVAAGDGRAIPKLVADRLTLAADHGRERAGAVVRGLPFPQAAEVVRFFNRLSATAAVLSEPKAAGLYDRNWTALGLTVNELAVHMAKYGLTFAPADEEAYTTLHRGLVGYYLTLAQERK